MTRSAATVVLSFFVFGAAAWSQGPVPVGDQFQINTSTQNNQMRPSMAVDPLGNFVVVWQSDDSNGTDTSGRSIQAQRYNANGAPLGAEFQVNTYTTLTQDATEVAMDSQGNFVVVWTSRGSDGTDTLDEGIHGQRFDSDGNPIGGEFQVNTYTTDKQTQPAIAVDSLGNFVVVWESYGSYGTDTSYNSIQGQLYDSTGAPVGGEFQVNTYTTHYQEYAAVAADGQGNFIVVWEGAGPTIKGQLYDDSGTAVGGEFQISATNGGRPAVSADSLGNFVVAWESYNSSGTDTSEDSVQAKRYDSDGNPVGGQFQVNTYTTERQIRAAVSMDPQGSFVVAWESDGSSGTDNGSTHYPDYSIQGQLYDSNGAPVGEEFQVNSYTTNDQQSAAVAGDGKGNFIVVWDSNKTSAGNDSRGRSVQGQRYSAGAEVIFSDAFETADTSEWSSTVQ